jgi:peptide-methionine (R)-S-oxide reductase
VCGDSGGGICGTLAACEPIICAIIDSIIIIISRGPHALIDAHREGALVATSLRERSSMLAALRRVARPAAVAVAAGGAAVIVAAVRGLGSGRREDSDEGPRAKSDADWFHVLTRDQFHVLRMGGTEHPFSGEYVQFSPAGGHFACAGCALPLYSAGSKLESSCGWPAFDKSVGGSVLVQTDFSLGRVRSEIVCAGCGGHLGRACTRFQPERRP